jgi:hypothetical protein
MNKILTAPQLREINQGLYNVNEAQQHLEVMDQCGVDCDERRLRLEHVKKILETLRDAYGKPSA